MSNRDKIERAKAILDQEYDWPATYMFKFIVPSHQEQQMREIFPVADVKLRFSSNGRYLSMTVSLRMESSDEVLAIYEQARKVKGAIAL